MAASTELKGYVQDQYSSLKEQTYRVRDFWASKLQGRNLNQQSLPVLEEQIRDLEAQWDELEQQVGAQLKEKAALKPLKTQRATCMAELNRLFAKAQKRVGS